jgi:hypothetical protein
MNNEKITEQIEIERIIAYRVVEETINALENQCHNIKLNAYNDLVLMGPTVYSYHEQADPAVRQLLRPVMTQIHKLIYRLDAITIFSVDEPASVLLDRLAQPALMQEVEICNTEEDLLDALDLKTDIRLLSLKSMVLLLSNSNDVIGELLKLEKQQELRALSLVLYAMGEIGIVGDFHQLFLHIKQYDEPIARLNAWLSLSMMYRQGMLGIGRDVIADMLM